MQRTVLFEFGGNNMAFKSWVGATLFIQVYSKQHTTSEASMLDESARDHFDIKPGVLGVGWGGVC